MKTKLVLLPGYDGDGTNSFRRLEQLLQDKFEITKIDFPYKNKNQTAFSLDELVNYVHRKIAKLGAVKMMGFSMGGFVAVRYAEKYTLTVESLILISSAVMPADSRLNRVLMKIAVPVLKSRLSANIFAAMYSSKLLKKAVGYLPVPRVEIPYEMGYAYFGTLAKVMQDVMSVEYSQDWRKVICGKDALLFRDDLSFPAETYLPLLEKYGFKVTVNKHGGHATAPDYWDQVAEYLNSAF